MWAQGGDVAGVYVHIHVRILGQTTTKEGLCRRTDPGTEPRDLRSEETRRRRGRRTSSSLRKTKPDRPQREASPHKDRTKGLTRKFFYISHPVLVRTCLEVCRAELRLLLEKNYKQINNHLRPVGIEDSVIDALPECLHC